MLRHSKLLAKTHGENKYTNKLTSVLQMKEFWLVLRFNLTGNIS